MFTLRATGKLITRLKLNANLSPPRSTGLLGDWYANWHVMQPNHLVMAVSERSLLPVLVPARDIAHVPERLRLAVGDVLRALHVPEVQVVEELSHMTEWTVAKTANRRVLGAMNDFSRALESLVGRERNLLRVALALADTPSGPIGMESPGRATVELFASPVLH